MSFNKYFNDELSALRELGREFSERNPRLAPFLSAEAQDPDVERLLEGFAFLTGRLRQKLDDELPEITHSLMSLLWPQFLRPLPSMSLVHFSPLASMSERQKVKKGIELHSRTVDRTTCVFRTCYDVMMHPLRVTGVERKQLPTSTRLSLKLGITANVCWADFDLDQIRFYLHGEVRTAQLLYLWMFRYLNRVEVIARGQSEEEQILAVLSAEDVNPVGFGEQDCLLPPSPHLLHGFRLVQEYFSLPEKFHFFDVTGLQVIRQKAKLSAGIAIAKELELRFLFDRPFDSHIHLGVDNFRLHCTPVINLFRHDAIPIRADHRKTEYRVLPSGNNPEHYEIFSIDKVQGWGHQDHQNHLFRQFESFDHFESVPVDKRTRFYRERIKPSVRGVGLDSYITFVNQYEHSVFPQTETVSLDLTCSNRHLATLLGVGDICVATGSSPEYASFSNITSVTPTYAPPLDQGFHWRLISNMSLNYLSLTDVKSLKAVLSTYDYKSYYDRQQALASQHRLDAFDGVQSLYEDRLHQGRPVRGRKTRVRLKESYFANEGDMFLFATILNELFALSCSINSFHHLVVHGVEHGEIYQWKPRTGSHPLV